MTTMKLVSVTIIAIITMTFISIIVCINLIVVINAAWSALAPTKSLLTSISASESTSWYHHQYHQSHQDSRYPKIVSFTGANHASKLDFINACWIFPSWLSTTCLFLAEGFSEGLNVRTRGQIRLQNLASLQLTTKKISCVDAAAPQKTSFVLFCVNHIGPIDGFCSQLSDNFVLIQQTTTGNYNVASIQYPSLSVLWHLQFYANFAQYDLNWMWHWLPLVCQILPLVFFTIIWGSSCYLM